MKTKFKYLTLMAAALLVGFSSCSNDNEADIDNGPAKSVFLKITNEDAPATYAETPVQGATTVGFSSGDLYFVNASGVILKHYTISNAATSATNISLTDIQAGQAIENLSAAVAAVYVVGNTPSLPTSGNISVVKAKAIAVASQATIGTVNLYGTSTLTAPVEPATYHTCTVALKPTVARIELTDIKAGGVITGFKVDGVFVDNYYSQATADGSVVAGDLKYNGTASAAFTNNSTAYPETLTPAIYDWYGTALQSDANVVALADSKVWGYNLFATEAGSTVPRIVIRLKNITTIEASGVTFSDPQFITIQGFKSGDTSLTGIKAGEVYNIAAGALVFDETVLTPTPNLSTIDVNVKVTLVTWVPKSVTPEL